MIEFKGVQLAQHWEGWEKSAGGRDYVIVEPKVDGYRLSAIVEEDGSVSFRCRDEEAPKWIEHLGHLGLEISDLGLEPGMMVDGEVMADDWNETSKLLRTYRDSMDEDDKERIRREVKFHVFDLVNLKALELRPPQKRQRKPRLVDPTPQSQRTLDVRALVGLTRNPAAALQTLPGKLCTTQEEVDAAYAEFCQSYEGAIVKLPDEPYYLGTGTEARSHAWLKIKPLETAEITLTDSVEGEGKHKGRLGALVGQKPDGTVVRVGTGFDDAARARLWAMRDRLPGLLCEISHQAGKVAAARHPVFIRIRDIG